MESSTLSRAGKMVFINSNLSSTPFYIMSANKIFNKILKELDRANRKFFWNNNIDSDHDQSLIPLKSYNKIYRPNCEGGQDIRLTRMLIQLCCIRWCEK